MSLITAFVRAARALLWMQVGAAVLATGLSVWALIAVRDLAIERDRLADQVVELQSGRTEPSPMATPTGPVQTPLDTEVRPPAIMPVYIPIVTDAAITPPIPPVDVPPAPDSATDAPPTQAPTTPPTSAECAGPNADPRRCRPGRWTRPDRPVVVSPVPQAADPPQRTPDAPRPN